MTTSPDYSFISKVSSRSLFNYSTITFEDDMEYFSNQDVQVQVMKETGSTSYTQDVNTNKNTTQNDSQSVLGLINHRQTQQSDKHLAQQSRIFSQQSVESNICDREIKEQWDCLGSIQTDMTSQYGQLKQVLKNKTNQTDSVNINFDQDQIEKENTQIQNHGTKFRNDIGQKLQNILILEQQSSVISEQELAHYTEKRNIMDTQYSLPTTVNQKGDYYYQVQKKQQMETQISQPWTRESIVQNLNQKENNTFDSKTYEYNEQKKTWVKTENIEDLSWDASQQNLCESYAGSDQSGQSNCTDIRQHFEDGSTQQDENVYSPVLKPENQQENQQAVQWQSTQKQNQNWTDSNGLQPFLAPRDSTGIQYSRPTLKQIVEEKSDQLATQEINMQNQDALNQTYLNLQNSTSSEIFTSLDDQITEKQEKIAQLNTSGFKPKPQIIKDLNKNYIQTINKQYDGVNFIVYHASLQNWSIIKKVLDNKVVKNNYGLLNSKDQQNKNLLFYAVYYGKNNIVKSLLKFPNVKEQINIITRCNNSPFKCSILNNNQSVSFLLFQKGADPNRISYISGQPLVMELIQYANAEVVKNFVTKFQPNFSIPNKQGQLPLQYFCKFRSNLYSDKSPYRYNIQQIQQIDYMYNIFAAQQQKSDFNIQEKSR